MNLGNRNRNKLIAGAMIIVALLFLLYGCKSTRHYVKVATDTEVTNKEKAIIAPWVMANFPGRDVFIPGKNDTIIEVVQDWEVLGQLNEILDSLIMLPRDTAIKYIKENCKPTKEIVNIIRVDTFRVSNGAEVYNLQQQVATKEVEIKKLEFSNSELLKKANKLKEVRNYLIGVLSLIGFGVIVFVMAKLKVW